VRKETVYNEGKRVELTEEINMGIKKGDSKVKE
jgi:hypothetical protein